VPVTFGSARGLRVRSRAPQLPSRECAEPAVGIAGPASAASGGWSWSERRAGRDSRELKYACREAGPSVPGSWPEPSPGARLRPHRQADRPAPSSGLWPRKRLPDNRPARQKYSVTISSMRVSRSFTSTSSCGYFLPSSSVEASAKHLLLLPKPPRQAQPAHVRHPTTGGRGPPVEGGPSV
jgi:hypothetical protein